MKNKSCIKLRAKLFGLFGFNLLQHFPATSLYSTGMLAKQLLKFSAFFLSILISIQLNVNNVLTGMAN